MGQMVTRYLIEGRPGQFLTDEGFFTFDRDDAAEFTDQDEAYETAAAYPGATVEAYSRFSDIASFLPAHPRTEHHARRAWIEQMNARAS
ncbi:hypothetical protein GOD68_18085 [Sinorhizobium medicae]|nr:hypothetical protein [Sinorhizobium medicae]